MNLPESFKKRMKSMLGSEYDDFINSYEQTPIFTGIRINPMKSDSETKIFNKFGTLKNIPWCKNGFYADKSKISGTDPYHIGGLFYFQEPSAMAAAEALPINAGDFVLDLCAAPGGKSTQIGAKLNNTGLLVSNEIIKKRADILSENIERFGFTNTIVTNETPQTLSGKYPEFFDKIIVDAPCSGEGMFRKEPQAITEWSEEHVKSCAARQKNILECAVKMLKNGGMLLYSTCTFSIEENEENAKYLQQLGMTQLPVTLNGTDTGIEMPMAARLLPHKQNGEGHFVALFQKNFGEENLLPLRVKQKKYPEGESLYRDFEKKYLNIKLDGAFYSFGERLYLLPFAIDFDKIKIVRLGLLLGECKKNRFEPSHALALALKKEAFKNTIEPDADILSKYLCGNTIPCSKNGYVVVLADGFPIGWGKASNGILKNHFPKRLRLR